MREFQYDGNTYQYYYGVEFNPKQIKEMKPYLNSGIIDMGAAFDIETTSFYSEKYKKAIATMWHWQFGLDDVTYTGRTWREFLSFMEKINALAEKAGATLLVLVQNFSFEFQFIKGLFDWNINEDGYMDIFAKSDREILYARWKNIEFRDTLALTGMGLAKYQKNYGTKVGKLSGDLDYSLKRHYMTRILDSEMAYNINDVQVLTSFFHVYLKRAFLDQKEKIPLTSTGIVRGCIKNEFYKLSKAEQREYRRLMRKCMPSRDLYLLMREFGFRGGLVHSNTSLCNDLIDESLRGRDLKSAHPTKMLRNLMPYKYTRKNKNAFKLILEQAETHENYGFMGVFKFYNIRTKGWHCLESKNKVMESHNAIYENGRLASAVDKNKDTPGFIKVCISDIDWKCYNIIYEWEKVECELLYECDKRPLPDFIRHEICKYFVEKETCPDGSVERNNAKKKVNGIFGMFATGLVEQELNFNPKDKKFYNTGKFKSYDELTKNLLVIPQWSLETAALTRLDICRALEVVGMDAAYYDTDSVKYLHYEKYEAFFEEYNKKCIEANHKMNTYEYDKKYFEHLGCFEYEYDTDQGGFKTLGAKRYIYKIDGEPHVTVAGMKKGSLENYCEKNGLDIFEVFQDKLILTAADSKKTTTTYTDDPVDDILEDYDGNVCPIHEESCVAIINIPFKMKVDMEFLRQIVERKRERENMIYKGVL